MFGMVPSMFDRCGSRKRIHLAAMLKYFELR
jgi:hypothetical protein